mmetsp:Transcript_19416/g.46919  ORF Transcript_19416/g.46919 Transcript_19416/m.46919 type:complete len:191 (+) Transcript_19416:111-683(+)
MADAAKKFAEEKLTLLRTKLDQIPALQEVEDKVKVPKEYLALGAGFFLAIIVFFGVGAATLTSIIGFVYPAWKSFESIEQKNKGDDIQWLVYWVLYAFFSLIETFKDFILYWIPFYYAFKLAFLLWAMLPQTKGSKFLYDSFLKDFLKTTSEPTSRIDTAMAEAKKAAETTAAALAGEETEKPAESKKDE